jgi:hypothetical protein
MDQQHACHMCTVACHRRMDEVSDLFRPSGDESHFRDRYGAETCVCLCLWQGWPFSVLIQIGLW